MKSLLSILCFFILFNCSTELVDTWKNPEISSYNPSKVLIIGMTSNAEAKQQFENQLKQQLESRGAKAVTSMEFFDDSMTTVSMTATQMDTLENKLIGEGFDTILFTKVIGVDD